MGYLKNVAAAVLRPVVKGLYDSFPNYGIGFSMLTDRSFIWSTSGMIAYNNKIFYTGANIYVRKMIEAPITFNRRKPSGKQKFNKFYSKSITNPERQHYKELALLEVEEHELNRMFDKPNGYQSGMELMEDAWFNYLFGDMYLFFEPIGEGSRNTRPFAVHSLNRNRVFENRSTDGFDRVLSYWYSTWNGQRVEIPKEYMLHLKHWNPNIDALKGLGVDQIASADISINTASTVAQGAAFENGGRGTLFSSDADLNNEGGVVNFMTATQMGALKETVLNDMAGARNNRKLKFTNGKVIVTPYGDTLAEMELTKAEEASWRNIFAIIGLPWALSPAASSSSENSVITGYKAFVTNLVISELRKFDQKLTQKIQQWWPEIIAVSDITEYTELAPDLKLYAEVYGKPVMYIDEVRKIFGADELPDGLGKNILVASGLMKLQDVVDNEFDETPEAETL